MLASVLSVTILWILWGVVGRSIRQFFIAKTTAVNELSDLGVSRTLGKIRGTAVICGGRYPFASILHEELPD